LGTKPSLLRKTKEKGVSCVLLTPLIYWCPGRETIIASLKEQPKKGPKNVVFINLFKNHLIGNIIFVDVADVLNGFSAD